MYRNPAEIRKHSAGLVKHIILFGAQCVWRVWVHGDPEQTALLSYSLHLFATSQIQKRQSQSTPTFNRLRRSTSNVFIAWYFPCLLPLTRSTFHCYSFRRGHDICGIWTTLSLRSHNTQTDKGKGLSSWKMNRTTSNLKNRRNNNDVRSIIAY